MTIGIYKLNFNNTDKVYIGQSSQIEIRFGQHLRTFANNTASPKLLEAYKIYGTPTLEILCECSIEDMHDTEKEAIEIFDAINNGFNKYEDSNSTPNKKGPESGNAKYTKEQVISVFNYLVDSPEITTKEISTLTGVSISIVQNISSSAVHMWLKEEFPERYEVLKSLKGKRNRSGISSRSKLTQEQALNILNLLIIIPTMSIPEISNITGVSKAIINNIASFKSQTWLEKLEPEKYGILKDLKGKRDTGSTRSAKIQGKTYPTLKSPTGELFEISNINQFAREHDLNGGNLCNLLNKKAKTHKGWVLA